MKAIQQNFSVPFTYTVHFTADVFDVKNSLLAEILGSSGPGRAFFVVDEGVVRAHPLLLDKIRDYTRTHSGNLVLLGDPLVVPGGEKVKNDDRYVEQILESADRLGIDRHSFIVVIGGGAVLDMAGFASAIAHRGIRLVRIPTTVLAQNDSGIGVKNGINAYNKKNFLGTFAPPFSVINDPVFLRTLSNRDWCSGISEAVKVALIKDSRFFQWIEVRTNELISRDLPVMQELIYRCAQMHLDHIAGGDPFECGSSRPLDFGHWAAHKLEQLSGYELRHGEAVAIGICLDATYSYLDGRITEQALNRIMLLFRRLGFRVYIPELSGENILKGLEEFREHLGGELTIMLLADIGRGTEVHQIDSLRIRDAIKKLEEFQKDNSQI